MVQEPRLACIDVCTCGVVCSCCEHTVGSRHLRGYERSTGVAVQTCPLGAVVQTGLVSRKYVGQACHLTLRVTYARMLVLWL